MWCRVVTIDYDERVKVREVKVKERREERERESGFCSHLLAISYRQ